MRRKRTRFESLYLASGIWLPDMTYGVPVAAFNGGGGGSGGDSSGSGDGGAQGASGGDSGAQKPPGEQTGKGSTSGESGQEVKTFTQEQVTAMMTSEKEQGRRAVLKELGITDPTQAKSILEAAGKLSDATKPADQKLDEKDRAIQTEKTAREAAEQKLELVVAKTKAEHLDDVLLLAKARVTDKVDFKAAIGLVKTAMPQFFEDDASTGTGDPPGGKKSGKGGDAGYGKRAAAIAKEAKGAKSSFFSRT